MTLRRTSVHAGIGMRPRGGSLPVETSATNEPGCTEHSNTSARPGIHPGCYPRIINKVILSCVFLSSFASFSPFSRRSPRRPARNTSFLLSLRSAENSVWENQPRTQATIFMAGCLQGSSHFILSVYPRPVATSENRSRCFGSQACVHPTLMDWGDAREHDSSSTRFLQRIL